MGLEDEARRLNEEHEVEARRLAEQRRQDEQRNLDGTSTALTVELANALAKQCSTMDFYRREGKKYVRFTRGWDVKMQVEDSDSRSGFQTRQVFYLSVEGRAWSFARRVDRQRRFDGLPKDGGWVVSEAMNFTHPDDVQRALHANILAHAIRDKPRDGVICL